MRIARGRRAIVVIGVVGLLAGIVGVVRPAIGVDAGGRSPGSGQGSGTAPTVAERTASARARASGQRVEVVAKRSETMEVFAEPNGTYTAQLHPGPVRVRRGERWMPVDTNLTRRADGSVAPGATVVLLAFSGGGSGPLVRLGSGERQASLYWPRPLPAPVLAGDAATYPEVLPGVDLRLIAAPTGFHELLVVKTRQAAGSPALARVRFGMRASGLSQRAGKHGGVDLVDGKGRVAFTSPPPALWDAGSRSAVGRFELAKDAISVLPDQRLLRDPATVFPVMIDPDYLVPFAGWTKVFSGKPDQSYWGGGIDDGWGKVGYCGWGGCNSIGTSRTYAEFDIRALHGAVILNIPGWTSGAEFNAHEAYAPTCHPPAGTDYAVDLEHVTPFDGSLTWNRQQGSFPGPIGGARWEVHGYDGSCGPAWIGWGVGDQVRWSNDRTDYVAFMLHANHEGEAYGWKKFDGYQLLVHYQWRPNVPSSISWSAGTTTRPCSTDASNPHYVNNQAGALTLRATGTDPDGLSDPLWMEFEWWNRGGSGPIGSTVIGPQNNGSEFTTTIPAGRFSDGQHLSWHAHAGDGWTAGAWGPQTGSWWCQIDIDNTAPGKPTVTMDPSQSPTVGAPVSFTVRAADADVTRFAYGLERGGTVCRTTNSVNATTLGGSATFKVTPLEATTWDLWVAAVDRAGNMTASASCEHVRFSVARGRKAVAYWPLDGHWNLTAVPDVAGDHDGTVAIGPANWTLGRVGDALQFNGSSGQVVTGGGPAVRTDQSFSVSAWVKLDGGSGSRTAVSQDAGTASGFYLQVTPEGRWAMSRPDSRAVSAGQARLGVWTHLVGTFDQTTRQWVLFVNGERAATNAADPVTSTAGPVRIGAGRSNGNVAEFFPGAVDDVRVYDRMLSDLPYLEPGESAPRSEIARLAGQPVEEAYYPLDEGAGARAGDVSGNYRTATLGGGATLTPSGHIGGALQIGSTTSGFAATAGPAVRTDQSFTVAAWVKRGVSDNGTRAAVSQDSGSGHGFLLGYISERGTFAFRVVAQDGQMPSVPANGTAEVGVWTHLAGTYDAATRQLYLYVNGDLQPGTATVPTPFNAAGALQIGRSKWAGNYTDPWAGSIDEVHAYSGVLSDPEIAQLSGQSEPRPPSLFAGAFDRFARTGGPHYTSGGSGPVPPGYYLEGGLGFSAPEDAPDTRVVYSCRDAAGPFLDRQPNCGGAAAVEVLGRAGRMYTTQPTGVPTGTVYRCLVLAGGDRFISFDPNCESTPDRIRQEFVLGYTRLLAPLIRSVGPGGAHWTSSHGYKQPAGYTPEAVLGYVALGGIPGSPPVLRLCQVTGTDDEFLWTDAGCDGQQDLGAPTSGWVWTSPPAGVESAGLFACRGASGERFESLDDFCEGGTVISQLGYVVTRP